MTATQFLLAVDIGGTFTDLVLLDQMQKTIFVGKVLTTYPDASQGVLTGVHSLLSGDIATPSNVQRVIHGTTLVQDQS